MSSLQVYLSLRVGALSSCVQCNADTRPVSRYPFDVLADLLRSTALIRTVLRVTPFSASC